MSKLTCQTSGVSFANKGHVHKHAHILLPLVNRLEITMDGHAYNIPAHHLCFVPPSKYHHCLGDRGIIMINIPQAMIRKEDTEILSSCICIPVGGVIDPLTQLIQVEVEQNSESYTVRYLYYYLYEKLLEAGSYRSLKYIREHFSENITIENLAKLENYNTTYFSYWFKKQTALSPSRYIRRIRIEKAKELLIDSAYSLVDIAIQVGYSSGASL